MKVRATGGQETSDKWEVQLRKGCLELAILAALWDGKRYGLEVLRRIRARDKSKNIPVVVVTSSDSPSDRGEAARLGASYFRKPVSYGEFVEIGAFLRAFLKANNLL